ncbi:hypothetical protein, partial [Pseudomonas aeruginosa]|uniref:hypothetical protein n=1 Tax=Pseudomonas aeruginosa TaxID=287 RepID=UPI0038942225
EFGIRHRGSTVPERSGVALSFCRRQLLSDCATELAYPAKIYLTNTLAMISAEKGENARCLEYAHRVQKQIPVRDDGQPAEDLLPAEHAFAMEQRAKADALSERCSDEK